jgi:hypothetical protein
MADRPNTDIAVFPKAGHALFVDDSKRFNALLAAFLQAAVPVPPAPAPHPSAHKPKRPHP